MMLEKSISDVTKFILTLSFVKGIGKVSLLRAIDLISSSPERYLDGVVKSLSVDADELDRAKAKANFQCNTAHELGHVIISPLDKLYPERLITLEDRPPILYCSGNLSLFNIKNACVIGTREPTLHGEEIASRITSWLSKSDWSIVSGLAKGIDKIAHQTSLKYNGKTISVMATGLDKIYPATHKELAEDIVSSGGLLVSEYGYKSYVGKSNFVQRDRIQAGLSDAVFLIQSGLSGGSLYASKAILEYNRPLIVVAQSMTDNTSRPEKAMANIEILNSDIERAKKILSINEFDERLLIKLTHRSEYKDVEKFIIENSTNLVNISKKQFDLI
ncbi:DNA-processing protein DprA [Shewanella algae]|uniref:DNA-processing protein DprA n=1 Tax=Shewanella algae TaxID=38313 RepID=UPI003005C930